jgi:hypothetical protein
MQAAAICCATVFSLPSGSTVRTAAAMSVPLPDRMRCGVDLHRHVAQGRGSFFV